MNHRSHTRSPATWAFAAALALAALTQSPHARAADCVINLGVVMELTGTAGEYGQAAAKSVEMALRDLNDAGGARGCRLVPDIKDSQGQATVAIDAANQLVQLKKVPVIIGSIASSTTIPGSPRWRATARQTACFSAWSHRMHYKAALRQSSPSTAACAAWPSFT
jgi:ABC-type branched-subunit amino acid transport system substrate-binding protein